ncbi:MAG: hypothetical protein NZO16_02120 [Deltaproteobacteria bacterium]|nr:hypothetical protein [Deltaproteobacteria bacterium]
MKFLILIFFISFFSYSCESAPKKDDLSALCIFLDADSVLDELQDFVQSQVFTSEKSLEFVTFKRFVLNKCKARENRKTMKAVPHPEVFVIISNLKNGTTLEKNIFQGFLRFCAIYNLHLNQSDVQKRVFDNYLTQLCVEADRLHIER